MSDRCEHCGNVPKVVDSIITVRMTHDLHEALKKEAHRREISLNKLCVETLKTALPVASEVLEAN